MTNKSTRQLRLRNDLGLSALSLSFASPSDLPVEIWHVICSYVDRKSLPSLRLTCTKLANIAVTPLFAEIYVNWLPRAFRRISVIAAHPKLCHHVRILSFEQCLLNNELEDFETWQVDADTTRIISFLEEEEMQKGIEVSEKIARYRRRVNRHTLPTDEETRRCLHQVITILLSEQKSLLEKPHLESELADIISKLRNLHTIQIVSGLCNWWKCVGGSPIDNQRSYNNTLALQLETFMRDPSYLFGNREIQQHPLLPFSLLVRALPGAAYALTNLSIANLPAKFWHSYESDGCWDNIKSTIDRATFTNLRSLKLCFGVFRPPKQQQLASFIGCFRSLTSLQLEIRGLREQWYEWWREDIFGPDPNLLDWNSLLNLSGILDHLNLCHLQELKIDHLRISEETFNSFMARHAQTLHTISFSMSYMESPGDHATRIPSWKRALTEIAPVMSLKHVDLGIVNDSFMSWLLAVLIRSGDERLPLQAGNSYRVYCRQMSEFLRSGGKVAYPELRRRDGSILTGAAEEIDRRTSA